MNELKKNVSNLQDLEIKEIKGAKCNKCEKPITTEDYKNKNYILWFYDNYKYEKGELTLTVLKITHGYTTFYDCSDIN